MGIAFRKLGDSIQLHLGLTVSDGELMQFREVMGGRRAAVEPQVRRYSPRYRGSDSASESWRLSLFENDDIRTLADLA